MGGLGVAIIGCGLIGRKGLLLNRSRGRSREPADQQAGLPEEKPAPAGNAAAGKTVFTGSAGCSGCHTLADAGATGTVGPNLDQLKPPYDKVVTQVTNGGAVMPAFKSTLTPQQIADVAAYVSSVAGK